MTEHVGTGKRFKIKGNEIIVSAGFDPRYQRGAEGELLNTLQTLMDETGSGIFVLDLHRCDTLPSMLIGIVVESHRRVAAVGGGLVLRIRSEHRKSLPDEALQRLFVEQGELTDEDGVAYIEFVSPKSS